MLENSTLKRNFLLFLFGVAGMGLSSGITEIVYNNYLRDVFAVNEVQRGLIEFPRELPGFLAALMVGLLISFPEPRIAALAIGCAVLGIAGMGTFTGSFGVMLLLTMLWSAGQHLFMPVRDSIAIALAGQHDRGQKLAQVSNAMSVAMIFGYLFVWIGFGGFGMGYPAIFLIAAVVGIIGVYPLLKMTLHGRLPMSERPRFIVRRRYVLYYILEMIAGARKQIFLTFGPWVIITILDQPATTLAKIRLGSAVFGIFMRPLLGWGIDRLGERSVMVLDAVLLMVISLTYAFALDFFPAALAMAAIYVSYGLDDFLFSVSMARAVYLSRIVQSQEELIPTLSLGVSINHAMSMALPVVGGLVWKIYGFQWVFVGSAALSVLNLIAALYVGRHARAHATHLTYNSLDTGRLS